MDKKGLKQYQALKREVVLLEQKLDKLYDRAADIPIVLGKVVGSSHDFPYTQVRTSVQMQEPEEAEQVSVLIRLKKARIDEANRKLVEIEQFIAAIPESDTRQMFELTYIDGLKQEEVAEIVGLEQSSVSKRITAYINFHTIHKKTML